MPTPVTRDEHCHIIYGVDDGAKDLETSLKMLDAAAAAGVGELWATPHMRWDDFDQALVKDRFAELREHAQDRGIEMRLGYEVYYKALLKQGLETAPRYVLEGTDMLLMEFNTEGRVSSDWDRTVYRLQSEFGLEVTWAHPERYTSVWDEFDLVHRIKEAGCRIQVSAGDIEARLFSKMRTCARRIMRDGLCDALVSDAHAPEHYETYAKMCAKDW